MLLECFMHYVLFLSFFGLGSPLVSDNCRFFLKRGVCFFLTADTGGYILCIEGMNEIRLAAEPGRRFKR